jgi:hypothetical protein
MLENKKVFMQGDKIFIDKTYTKKVKLKRSTKLIFLNFSCKKWNIWSNFKVKCHSVVDVPNVITIIFMIVFISVKCKCGLYFRRRM